MKDLDIQLKMYINLKGQSMQVSKWGNSLAVRFPAGLVQALDLKEGEEVDLHLVGERSFEVSKKPSTQALLARLHTFRGRLPTDFHFDRLQANERGDTLDDPKGLSR
jgi:antitoxin MazE